MSDKDEKDLWERYAQGVQKLGDKRFETPQPIKEAPTQAAKSVPPLPPPEPVTPSPPPPQKKEALDPRIERNMSLGDVVIEARLDLHGHTEDEAYEAFRRFVERESSRGRRLLLVITGKGEVLKKCLPRWTLSPPFENRVLATRVAARHHGGEGAYYILLRRH